MFCQANGCASRVLVAESSVLFTVLDTVLGHEFESRPNAIFGLLGPAMQGLLFDLFQLPEVRLGSSLLGWGIRDFTYNLGFALLGLGLAWLKRAWQGPRLRDRFSHGQVGRLGGIEQSAAGVAVSLLLRFGAAARSSTDPEVTS